MKNSCNPKYSIIITTYNIENYIEECIKSVLNQKYEDYEVIVVDDCSTDNTLQVIEKYELKVLKTHQNMGTPGKSRNIGIEEAMGKYILFLDGDDVLYDDNVLKNIDDVIGKDEPEIVFMGYEYYGQPDKQRISTKENSKKQARLICDVTFAVQSRCWRKDFLIKNNIKFLENIFYEDEIFCMKSTILATKTKYSELKIFKYRRNRDGSVMSAPSVRKCSDWYRMLAEIVDLYNITPDEYKKYLLSFIKNENDTIPKRIASILYSLKNGGNVKLLPKREYEFKDFFENED